MVPEQKFDTAHRGCQKNKYIPAGGIPSELPADNTAESIETFAAINAERVNKIFTVSWCMHF